jgi:hypothetical protein
LLKKVQETKGKISYGELAGHLSKVVSSQPASVNGKKQTPLVNESPVIDKNWKKWKMQGR